MRSEVRSADAEVARIAACQHGLVTTAQLTAAGLSRQGIARRVAAGRLHPAHRGVYRVGHRAPSRHADVLAAVLAGGQGAVASHACAAHHLGLLEEGPPPVEISATREIAVPGVRSHRLRELPRWQTTSWYGVPCTSVPRTLVDLAGRLTLEELATAAHVASVRHHLRREAVARILERRPAPPGVGRLRAVLWGDAPILLSRLELRFQAILRRHRLPRPDTNRKVDDKYVDCRWLRQHVTVELDSYRFHSSRRAWEEDHRRDRLARARGDEYRRYTWGDLTEREAEVVADLLPLIGVRSA